MKLFLAFLVVCFVGGLVLADKPPRVGAAALVGLCLIAAAGFYFFGQI